MTSEADAATELAEIHEEEVLLQSDEGDDEEGGSRRRRKRSEDDEDTVATKGEGAGGEEGGGEDLEEDEEDAKAKRTKRSARFGLPDPEVVAALKLACACPDNACGFNRHRNPPPHFKGIDRSFCCSLCRISGGTKHGGHCERLASSAEGAEERAAAAMTAKEAQRKEEAEAGIDPTLPWSERKRLLLIARNGKWGDQVSE
jgi:hypothetical protein